MATDIEQIIKNLSSFYNFNGKTIAHVGAGGGALIDDSNLPPKIIAIDQDEEGLNQLKEQIKNTTFKNNFSYICNDFCKVKISCDTVFFEFCLHEMRNPIKTLNHAKGLAEETIIIDHYTNSEWSWYTCETGKISKSWEAIKNNDVKREEIFDATQIFKNYNELYDKLKVVGHESIKRIEKFKEKNNIIIQMPYGIVLL